MTGQEFFPAGVELTGEITPEFAEILSPQAIEFVAKIARRFEARRREFCRIFCPKQLPFARATGRWPLLPRTCRTAGLR